MIAGTFRARPEYFLEVEQNAGQTGAVDQHL
jgi:hypothetical protein